MWTDNETEFLARSQTSLKEILERLKTRASLNLLEQHDPKDTALVAIDMVKGFCSMGPLASPRIKALLPDMTAVLSRARQADFPIVAFGDRHPKDSLEFHSYPPHCVAGTEEAELADELAAIGTDLFIGKNSTNGFLEPEFQQWYLAHSEIKNFIVMGDCTDICVEQFALTLKTDLNRRNIQGQVIVPINLVDTYDAPLHHGDLFHVMALANMEQNGVTLCGVLYAQ